MKKALVFLLMFGSSSFIYLNAQNTEPPHYNYPSYRGYRSSNSDTQKKRINLAFFGKSDVINPIGLGVTWTNVVQNADGSSSFNTAAYISKRIRFRYSLMPDIQIQYTQYSSLSTELNGTNSNINGGLISSYVTYDLVPLEWLDITADGGIIFGDRSTIARLDKNYLLSNLNYGIILGSSVRFHFLNIFGQGFSLIGNCHYSFDFSDGEWFGTSTYLNDFPNASKVKGLQINAGFAYAINPYKRYKHVSNDGRIVEPIF